MQVCWVILYVLLIVYGLCDLCLVLPGLSGYCILLFLCLFGALNGDNSALIVGCRTVFIGGEKKKTRRERGLFRVGRVVVMVMCG